MKRRDEAVRSFTDKDVKISITLKKDSAQNKTKKELKAHQNDYQIFRNPPPPAPPRLGSFKVQGN